MGSTSVASAVPAPECTGTKRKLLTFGRLSGLGFEPMVFAMNWTVSASTRVSCRGWRGAARILLESAKAKAERAIVECIL